MSVEDLTRLLPQKGARFGAYTQKGNQAVARIMTSFVKKLIKLEEEAQTWRGPSVAVRLLAAEKAMEKYRQAAEKYAGEGLSDTDARDQAMGFIQKALKASGLSSDLVREFMYEAE